MAQRQSLYSIVKPNEHVILEGKLGFARLHEKTDSTSPMIQGKVYTVTINDPKLADASKWGLNPNAVGANTELGKNILREDVSHGVYTRKNGQKAWSFETNPNSKFAPQIIDMKTGDSAPSNEFLDGELASGQDVLVFFSTYEYDGKFGKGVSGSLDGVGVVDASHIQYFNGGGVPDFHSMFASPKAGASSMKKSASAPKKEDTSAADTSSDDSAEETDLDNLFDD